MSNQVEDGFKFLWPFQNVQTLSRDLTFSQNKQFICTLKSTNLERNKSRGLDFPEQLELDGRGSQPMQWVHQVRAQS